MKILLTIFVLFFSSSVLADDDLTGKKVICIKNQNDKIILLGFEFKKNKKVYVYEERSTTPLEYYNEQYETSTSQIYIFTDLLGLKINHYFIDRTNLNVTHGKKFDGSGFNFKNGECSLTNENIVKLFNQKLKNLKKQNIL